MMYIGKTGRRRLDRLGEHLRSVEGHNQNPCYHGGAFPVAEHFKRPDHSNIRDMRVSVYSNSTTRRKEVDFQIQNTCSSGMNMKWHEHGVYLNSLSRAFFF